MQSIEIIVENVEHCCKIDFSLDTAMAVSTHCYIKIFIFFEKTVIFFVLIITNK